MSTRLPTLMLRCGSRAVVLVTLACGSVGADVVFHNGSVASGGTNAVQIDFFTDSPDGALFAATNFRENATLIHQYAYQPPVEPPVLFFELAVRNSTDIAWKDFHVDLFGADFFGFNVGFPGGPLAREVDPVVREGIGPEDILFRDPANPNAIEVESSMIVRDGQDASLWMFFDDFVDPGEAFQLSFRVNDVGIAELDYTMHQAPSVIPAPGAALLGMLGFTTMAWAKKRRWV